MEGRGDLIFRWELPQSKPDGFASSLWEGAFGMAAKYLAIAMTERSRAAARLFQWIYFTQRTFFAGFYPLALKKYTLFFYLRVVYA